MLFKFLYQQILILLVKNIKLYSFGINHIYHLSQTILLETDIPLFIRDNYI